MKRMRSLRGLAGLAVIVGLLTFVVLPALATTPGAAVPPPSTSGVMPIDYNTGGQSNDCALFYASNPSAQPAYQYRIANPKSQKYTTTVNGSAVTFTLKLDPASAQSLPASGNQKYVDFTSTGARVVDAGIKGGTDETRYNYAGQTGGFVIGDGSLHAPAQATVSSTDPTPTQLYAISNITFCFNVGSASGTVYNDVNESTTMDTGDTPLAGWTVRLYKGVTAGTAGGGTVVGTTTSAADGTYRIGAALDPTAVYRLCEVPPSGIWAQSQPLPTSTTLCNGTGEKKKGYDILPPAAENVTGRDFGNVPAIAAPCPAAPFGTTDSAYQIQLAGCKSNEFVFRAGTIAGKPLARVWAGDQTVSMIPMVEKITWPYDRAAGQNQLTVIYNDVFPFTGATKVMKYCLVDPRTSSTSLVLAAAYSSHANKDLVLPAGETSCLITSTESAAGSFVAFVYSEADGWRSTA
jgi:hypothetical protein